MRSTWSAHCPNSVHSPGPLRSLSAEGPRKGMAGCGANSPRGSPMSPTLRWHAAQSHLTSCIEPDKAHRQMRSVSHLHTAVRYLAWIRQHRSPRGPPALDSKPQRCIHHLCASRLEVDPRAQFEGRPHGVAMAGPEFAGLPGTPPLEVQDTMLRLVSTFLQWRSGKALACPLETCYILP